MRSLLLALMVTMLVSPLTGQRPGSPCPSGVVRWIDQSRIVHGDLVELPVSGQPLKVLQMWGIRPIELSDTVPGLECRVRRSRKLIGGLIGFALGAGTGLLVGNRFRDDDPCGELVCFFSLTASGKRGVVVAVLGVVGAVFGAAIPPGSVWAPWGSASSEARVGLAVTGQGVGLRVVF